MGFHTLSIGATALLTAQYGLNVTGQNFANVDTPGYSRQILNQAATKGWTGGLGNAIVGNGVWTTSIRRVANEYLEKQLRGAVCTDEYYGTLRNCYSNIQSFFNEPATGSAISDAMNQFWRAMGDLDSHIESLGVRTTLLSEAELMTTRFNQLGIMLADYRKDIDNEVAESIKVINHLLNRIAELNQSVVTTECGGVSARVANDLRDQRGEALKQLYEYLDIDTVEEMNGSISVSIHGRSLVYYDIVKEIAIDKAASPDGTLVNIPVFASDRYPLRPTNGILAAQMEARDVIIPSYQKDINDLAANFIWEFNRAYSQTRGLESFSFLKSQPLNAPFNPAATLDQLFYKDYVPEGTFQIVNGNFEIIVYNKNTNQPITVNIEVDLDGRPGPGGEPDMILWDPDNPTASHSLINRMQKALDEALPGAFKVSIDRQYQISIEANSSDFSFCFGVDTSGVLAALGLNVFFTGHNAISMGVNQELREHPSLMGGSLSFQTGDNEGVKLMLAIRDKDLANLKGMTLEGHYQASVGRLGSEASRVNNMKELSRDIRNSLFNQREEMSGVNDNEESLKLIYYQRAFQAAAKFITTVDECYATLIAM